MGLTSSLPLPTIPPEVTWLGRSEWLLCKRWQTCPCFRSQQKGSCAGGREQQKCKRSNSRKFVHNSDPAGQPFCCEGSRGSDKGYTLSRVYCHNHAERSTPSWWLPCTPRLTSVSVVDVSLTLFTWNLHCPPGKHVITDVCFQTVVFLLFFFCQEVCVLRECDQFCRRPRQDRVQIPQSPRRDWDL